MESQIKKIARWPSVIIPRFGSGSKISKMDLYGIKAVKVRVVSVSGTCYRCSSEAWKK